MATDLQRLIVSLEARTKAFENALNKANGVANRRARSIESRFAAMNKQISGHFSGIGRSMVGAFAGGAGLMAATGLLDTATRIENALKVAGLSGEELTRVYDRLYESAQRNAAPLESLVSLYGRAAQAQQSLGVTTDDLLGLTETVAQALRVSGASAETASGALLQLGQALSGGKVQAEEYNSMIDGLYPLLQAAAAGLKEAGGDVSALTRLVKDGEVSSQAFFRAIEAGSGILEEKLAGAEMSISQAMENIRTALIDAARRFDDGAGASRRLAEALQDLQDYIETVDFNPATNSLLDFIEQVTWGINKLGELKQGIYDAARAFSEWHGGAAIGDALGMTRGDTAGKQQQAIDDRINAAFGDTGPAKSDRPTPSRPPTDIGTITKPKQVSLADYPVTGGGGGGSGKKGRGSRENDYQREVEQIKERTAAIQAETAAMAGINPLVNDYGYAIEKASAVHELLTAAQKAGIEITPELRAKIDQLAEGYAQASVAAEKLAESQDHARAMADDMRELGKSVMSGFISDLRAGKSATEALANALGKVGDKLLDLALDAVFGLGNFSGGGGLLGGLLSIFPFARGGIAAHGKPVPLKKFARGGVSRTAAIFGEEGPEAAVPLPDGRSIPVDLRVPKVQPVQRQAAPSITINAPINAPGADPAALARVERSVQELGKNIPKMVDARTDARQTRKTRS